MKNNVFAGGLIALGLFFGGLFIYCGITRFANKDRAVTVKGLSTREVEADYAVWPGSINVHDNWSDYYGNHRPEYKYTLNTSLIVSTNKVQLVVASQGKEAELLKEGIIVKTEQWNLDYQYNGLPELKPSMIEEATQNARAVAQKFADDAQCSLGSIRRASQGQFSVENDQYQPWVKHVRVVTTVDYFLD